MLEHEHGAERVGAEGEQRVIGVDLGGGFFGKEEAGDDEGELEGVGVRGGEVFLALCCCVGDS